MFLDGDVGAPPSTSGGCNAFKFFLLANGIGGHIAFAGLVEFVDDTILKGSLGFVCALLCAFGQVGKSDVKAT